MRLRLPRFLRATLHPARYHGHGQQPPFFEGWYFKLVDATERHRLAIIPGVSLTRGADEPHSFVQVLDGATGLSAYHRYPLDAFWAADDAFHVRIATGPGGEGDSVFTAAGIRLNVGGPHLAVRGEVRFHDIRPWPVTLRAPGIMGWYAWVPLMQTYHGVVSLDHRLSGALEIDGRRVEWTLSDDTYRLHMVATRPEGAKLQAPTTGGMDRRIGETMNAQVDLLCTEINTGQVVFRGTGRHAGLEVEGDVARLR